MNTGKHKIFRLLNKQIYDELIKVIDSGETAIVFNGSNIFHVRRGEAPGSFIVEMRNLPRIGTASAASNTLTGGIEALRQSIGFTLAERYYPAEWSMY